MKIAIISDFFSPELSGVSDAVTLLGTSLMKRDHDVLFIVPKYPNTVENPELKVKRIPSIPIPNSPTGQGRFPLPIGYVVKTLFSFKPDIIHTHSPYTPGLEALIYAKISKTPIVGTHHTITSEFMKGAPKFLVTLVLRYNSWFYNRTKFVTAPSLSLIDEMREYGLKSKSISLSNPIDITHFSPNEKMVNDPIIFYAGRLSFDKHVEVIIQALKEVKKEIPDAKLVIAGRGDESENLKKLARDLSLEDSVIFKGFVKMNLMPPLYKESALFVIMSTSESQSLVLMQALASGIPTIGAHARALPEYITPDVGVTVTPGDYVGLAKTIVEILRNSEKRRSMGKAGVEKVKAYSKEKIAEEWEKIYKNHLQS